MEVVIRGTSEEIAALVLAVQERKWPKKSIQFDVDIIDVSRLAKVLRKATDDRAPEAPERSSN